jgi:RNA polymerase subunit RPABC4/transcription elongation factor Spt4
METNVTATSASIKTSDSDRVILGACPNCEKSVPLDAESCPHCSASFGPASEWKVVAPEAQKSAPRLSLSVVWKGRAGLAKTFWFGYIAAGFMLSFTLGQLVAVFRSLPFVVLAIVLPWCWLLFFSVATWRAAHTYPGRAAFAVLAKVVVAVLFAASAVQTASFLLRLLGA